MSDMIDKPVHAFLDELASKQATPGGGSAAALMGAQAAALVSMVCNLTLGKAKFADVEADMHSLLTEAEALRCQLSAMIKADMDVFDKLMGCYALPKVSEAEKAQRSGQIQLVLKEATLVPLECATACSKVIALSQIAAEKGNPGAISDAGVAAMAAYAGMKSAALNVYINTSSIKDRDFADAKLAEIETILQSSAELAEQIYQYTKSKL